MVNQTCPVWRQSRAVARTRAAKAAQSRAGCGVQAPAMTARWASRGSAGGGAGGGGGAAAARGAAVTGGVAAAAVDTGRSLADPAANGALSAANDALPASVAVFDAAAHGDPEALRIRDEFAEAVAAAVRLVALTCDVEHLLVGGGVAQVGPPLLDTVAAVLRGWEAESRFLAHMAVPTACSSCPRSSRRRRWVPRWRSCEAGLPRASR